jgi:hypothetical protein
MPVSRLVLGVAVAAIVVSAVLFLFAAVPAWDDLIRATGPTQMTLWQYVIGHVYMHWQGRWASCGLEAVMLPHLDITRFYFVLIAAVAIVDALGVYVLCRWFTATSPRKTSAAVAACLLALLWAGVPSLAETVYWFVGAVENAMVLALAAMLVITLNEVSKSVGNHIAGIALLSLLAICVCGFHELYGTMLCIALTAGTLWSLLNKGIDRTAWIAVTVAAAIGLVIVVMAPGNALRMVSDGGHHGRHFVYDLKIAISQIRHFVPRWLLNPKLLAASVWVVFSPTLRREKPPTFFLRLMVPGAWLAMLAVGFFAPSWAFGAWMPPRTLSGIFIVFVIGWLITLHVWTPRMDSSWPREKIASIASIILGICLLVIGNFPAAVGDIRHRLGPWHSAIEDRFATLRSATGQDALIPPLPKPYPKIVLDGEINSNPGDYHNWSTVIYFKLRSLRLVPEKGPVPPPPEQPTRQPGGASPS